MKYLFECHFNDGTHITQTQADVSLTTPGKNAFYDVLQRIDDVEIFGVFSDEEPNVYTVDLTSGLFAVNDVVFKHHDPRLNIPPDAKFRLIFFKRHVHTFSPDLSEIGHDIGYWFGWQTTIDGQNFQSTMSVQ